MLVFGEETRWQYALQMISSSSAQDAAWQSHLVGMITLANEVSVSKVNASIHTEVDSALGARLTPPLQHPKRLVIQ
jgi:hypothetical protein